MTTHRLSGLQRRILRQISQAEARSKWRVTASHDDLVRALGGQQGHAQHQCAEPGGQRPHQGVADAGGQSRIRGTHARGEKSRDNFCTKFGLRDN